MWNRHTMGKVQFLFFSNFLQVLATFTFWEEDWALGYNSMKSRGFPEMSYFPKIRSFQVIRQLVTQLVYTIVNINAYTPLHLWQKKNLLKYKKSQNIITMIVPCNHEYSTFYSLHKVDATLEQHHNIDVENTSRMWSHGFNVLSTMPLQHPGCTMRLIYYLTLR